MTATDVRRTIDAVWRIESAKLIAALGADDARRRFGPRKLAQERLLQLLSDGRRRAFRIIRAPG